MDTLISEERVKATSVSDIRESFIDIANVGRLCEWAYAIYNIDQISIEELFRKYVNTIQWSFKNIEDLDPSQLKIYFDSLSSYLSPYCIEFYQQNWTPVFSEKIYNESFNQEFKEALDKLDSIKELPHNWDTYGAVPIRQAQIGRSNDLLRLLYLYFTNLGFKLPQPFIAPVPDGSVQIEFDFDEGDIEITFDENGKIEYLICEANNVPTYTEGTVATPIELAEILQWRFIEKGTHLKIEKTANR